MSRIRLMPLVFGMAVLISTPALAQAPRVMTLDDARDLVRVSDPSIAPDGRTVLVTVSRAGAHRSRPV